MRPTGAAPTALVFSVLRRVVASSSLRSSSAPPPLRYASRLRVASSLGGWRRYRRRPCSLRRRAFVLCSSRTFGAVVGVPRRARLAANGASAGPAARPWRRLARARSYVAPLALRYSRPRAGRAAMSAAGGLRVFLPAFAGSVGLSLPLLDQPLWGLCLSALPRVLLVLLRATLRPDGARAQLGGASGRLPRRRPSWLAGPRVPCFASAGRFAPTARRCGRLRHSGVALRAAFFSATAGAVSRAAGGRSAGAPRAFSASPAGLLGPPDPPPTAFRTVAP